MDIQELKSKRSEIEMRISSFIQKELEYFTDNNIGIKYFNINLTPIKTISKENPVAYIISTDIDIKI